MFDITNTKKLCEEAKEPYTIRIFITPEMARIWMRMNLPNNRPVQQDRVNTYGRDMKGGRWKENAETIKFSKAGEMFDGQHRLQASIESGISFWSLVAFGVDPEAFLTIDRGQSRTVGQMLHLANGVGDYNAIAAVVSHLYRFRDGIMLTKGRPTAGEAEDLLLANPGVPEAIAVARRILSRFRAGGLPVVATCYYLFTRQDATLAETFFDALATGASLREVDPVYQLRARIINASASTTKRISAYELFALFFKTWNAEREQRTMNNLRWVQAESFPNIGPIENVNKIRPEAVSAKSHGGKRRGRQPLVKEISEPVPAPSKLDQLIQKHHGLDRRPS